ncbi:glycosyltransferase family 2 protein [Glycomyces arizonensis]|uniref:glycosyltransferase family 2 protein n=1 Tax=Glycomyces arizonensis TaxID=256035 RepID=UPI0004031037|nr:glycosyltransferase [Glycomyces arizonensis]
MTTPLVSVVIPVHNAMPYLLRGIESLLEQSLGKERVEIIAVDDGSTDGSGEALDRFAAAEPDCVRVVHQEASGTPSVPRNRGIELARGRYVFFLDADDYLGVEALERMVEMAEEHESDVVLGKLVGVAGRGVARSMFTRDQPRADLYSSRVYWNLTCLKLFRREMLERHGLRFRTDRRLIEDLLFTIQAYYHARNISVVGEYGCYYVVLRDDGGNLTSGGMQTPEHFQQSEGSHVSLLVDLVGNLVPEGPKRDFLMMRHWNVEGLNEMRRLLHDADPEARLRRFEDFRRLVRRWYTPGAAARLAPLRQLQYQLVLDDRPDDLMRMLEHSGDLEFHGSDDRVYLTVPGDEDGVGPEREARVDLTGSLDVRHWLKGVELTGTALRIEGTGRIAPVPSDLIRLRLEAVHSGTGAVRAVDLEHDDGHFTAVFGLEALLKPRGRRGSWRFEIVAGIGGTERRAPFGSRLGGALHGKQQPRAKARTRRRELALGFTEPGDQLMLDVERRFTAGRLVGAALRRAGLRRTAPHREGITAVRVPVQFPREEVAGGEAPRG